MRRPDTRQNRLPDWTNRLSPQERSRLVTDYRYSVRPIVKPDGSRDYKKTFLNQLTNIPESSLEETLIEWWTIDAIDHLLRAEESISDLDFLVQRYLDNGGVDAVHLAPAFDRLYRSELANRRLSHLAGRIVGNFEKRGPENYGMNYDRGKKYIEAFLDY